MKWSNLSVCETTYERYDVEERMPDCKVVHEEKCDPNGKCVDVPRMACEFVTMIVTKTIPNTEV